jgi:hypothetical protein
LLRKNGVSSGAAGHVFTKKISYCRSARLIMCSPWTIHQLSP